MKKLIFANILFCLLFIIFLTWYFHLSYWHILVNLLVASIGVCITIFFHLILHTLSIRWLHVVVGSLFSAFTYTAVLFSYLSYFVSLDNWAHPLTFAIFLAYLDEVPLLIETLPIPTYLTYSLFIALLIFILIVAYRSTRIVQKSLDLWKLNSNRLITILIWMILAAPTLVLLFSIQHVHIRERINKNSITRKDPLLSIFFYELQRESIAGINSHVIKFKEQYPIVQDFNKKNVILIICDALRQDHMGTYGYIRNTTPFLDSLSNTPNSRKFNYFFSTSSRSYKGISNTLSSTYNIAFENFFIHDALKKQGYKTKFLVSGDHTNFYGLRKHYGNSIDEYDDGFTLKEKSTDEKLSLNDDMHIINKLESLEETDERPTFLYLHLMSVHQSGTLQDKYNKYQSGPLEWNARRRKIVNDYDNRLAQLDDYLRKIFSLLKTGGFLNDAIVVITADHGQALFENGFYWHGKSTGLPETLIPLIISDIGNDTLPNSNQYILGNQIDIAPSILDLLDLPTPDVWEGESVFGPRSNGPVHVQERAEYSTIWHDNHRIFKYVFDNNSKEKFFSDITTLRQLTPDIDIDTTTIHTQLLKFFDL